MSHRNPNHNNNNNNHTLSSIIDYYSNSSSNSHKQNNIDADDYDDDDDDVLRKSYSMPLSMPDCSANVAAAAAAAASATSFSPILASDPTSSMPTKSSSSPPPPPIRTSKSEEQRMTTTNTSTTPNPNTMVHHTNLLPQHKLDRFGFIVNMDGHGNIIATSQRHNNSHQRLRSTAVSHHHSEDAIVHSHQRRTNHHQNSPSVDESSRSRHHTTTTTTTTHSPPHTKTATAATVVAPNSSSNYSIDTNYDPPQATRIQRDVRKTRNELLNDVVVDPSTNKNNTATTTTTANFVSSSQTLSPIHQATTITATTTTRVKRRNYYMQRRTKPSSSIETARTARRIMKWDTMLRYNIPNEVMTLPDQVPQERDTPSLHSLMTIPQRLQQQPLYNRKQRRYNILKRRLRKGIPNQYQRSIVWPILCHVSTKMKSSSSPGLYHSLLLQMIHFCSSDPEEDTPEQELPSSSSPPPHDETTTTTTTTTDGMVHTTTDTTTTTTNSTNTNNHTGSTNDSSTHNHTSTMTTATKGGMTSSNDVAETTKIEMNYIKTTNVASSTQRTTKSDDDNDQKTKHPNTTTPQQQRPPITIPFQYTKSFRSIQETIERDLHRTFPRHCMFYTTEIDDDDDDEYDDDDATKESDRMMGLNPMNDSMNLDHQRNVKNHPPRTISGNEIRSDDIDDQHSTDTRWDIQQRSICGTNEIRNLIRELDLVPQMASHLMMSPSSTVPTLTTEDDKTHQTNDNLVTKTDGTTITIDNDTDKNLPIVNGTNDSHNDTKGTGWNDNNNQSTGGCPTTHRSDTSHHNNNSNIHHHHHHKNGMPHPAANLLEGMGGQSRLRRVLKAYSVYDREIGYCQGMNFIAAMFLTIVTEEHAFWMLVAVMNDPPCRMRGMFGEGMKETHQALYVADKLIHQFLPKLAKHFEKESIHVTMYATQWLLTQFTSSFRFDLVTRLWDSFLFEGWKTTYRVMLALLQRSQNDLLSMGFEEILAFFRELPDRPDIDGSIVDDSMKIPLKTSHIRKYESEWRSLQQQ